MVRLHRVHRVHLEHRDAAGAVDLVGGRVARAVLLLLEALELGLVLEEVERELAAVERVDGAVLPELLGEGREVPGLHQVPPQLDVLDVLHLRHLLVLAQRRVVHALVLLLLGLGELGLLLARHGGVAGDNPRVAAQLGHM